MKKKIKTFLLRVLNYGIFFGGACMLSLGYVICDAAIEAAGDK